MSFPYLLRGLRSRLPGSGPGSPILQPVLRRVPRACEGAPVPYRRHRSPRRSRREGKYLLPPRGREIRTRAGYRKTAPSLLRRPGRSALSAPGTRLFCPEQRPFRACLFSAQRSFDMLSLSLCGRIFSVSFLFSLFRILSAKSPVRDIPLAFSVFGSGLVGSFAQIKPVPGDSACQNPALRRSSVPSLKVSPAKIPHYAEALVKRKGGIQTARLFFIAHVRTE